MNAIGKFFNDRRLWVITIAVFVLVVAVFDKNNLIEAWRLRQKINDLEAQKEYYQQKITEDSTILENLRDDDYLERYAREHYLMKRRTKRSPVAMTLRRVEIPFRPVSRTGRPYRPAQAYPFGQALSPFGTGNRRPALACSAASAVTFPSFFTTRSFTSRIRLLQGSTVAAFVPRFYSDIGKRSPVAPSGAAVRTGEKRSASFRVRGRTAADRPIRRSTTGYRPDHQYRMQKGPGRTVPLRSSEFRSKIRTAPKRMRIGIRRRDTRRHTVNHRTAAL
ncbi:MAG: FtsB family cell division protein [Alistipes onderdonkii]